VKNFFKKGNAVSFLIILVTLSQSCEKKPGIPVVTTANVTEVTQTGALTGGNITDDGGAEVTARGVCWGSGTKPTISSDKTTDGSGKGSFLSSITGLTPGTVYIARAYATNSAGTGYGEGISFTTRPPFRLPKLTTSAVTDFGSIYAVSGGNITDDGEGTDVVGVAWSRSENPTFHDENVGTQFSGTGTYSVSINGLSGNTTYYVRAFATNSAGTAYGNQVSFKTADGQIMFNPKSTYGSVTDIDGNVYKTVQIGSQTWMAENLRTTRYPDADVIRNVTVDGTWGALTKADKAYCYYKDNPGLTCSFGALYTWSAAMDGAGSSTASPSGVQGVCPTGWHLPSQAEWTTLINVLEGSSIAGGKMKETGTSHWSGTNVGATNDFGFTGLPAGLRYSFGAFFGNSLYEGYWSTDESSADNAWVIGLSTFSGEIIKNSTFGKKSGISVRCIRNN
jgi:uncharacterized protein (TIGR02145 family)